MFLSSLPVKLLTQTIKESKQNQNANFFRSFFIKVAILDPPRLLCLLELIGLYELIYSLITQQIHPYTHLDGLVAVVSFDYFSSLEDVV
ncbi:hypothetical protein D3C75_1178190 [compost metagenome]